jgi:hypothetical protein
MQTPLKTKKGKYRQTSGTARMWVQRYIDSMWHCEIEGESRELDTKKEIIDDERTFKITMTWEEKMRSVQMDITMSRSI